MTDSWSAQACAIWQQGRGVPPGGMIGKWLKPLIVKHGRRQVLACWEAYIQDRAGKSWCSPFDFASQYLIWRENAAVVLAEDGSWVGIPDEPEPEIANPPKRRSRAQARQADDAV